MSTIRVARRDRYTAINREALEDRRLSFKARGILAWALSKPDGWRFDADKIADESDQDGRTAVRSGLTELREHGYLKTTKFQNDIGQWVSEQVLYESPEDNPDYAASPITGPDASQPESGFPTSADRTSVPRQSGDLTLIQKVKTKRENPPTPRSLTLACHEAFERFWAAYPKRVDKQAAIKAWNAALRRRADPEHIIRAALAYAEDPTRQPKYTKNPASWLTAASYDNEPVRDVYADWCNTEGNLSNRPPA